MPYSLRPVSDADADWLWALKQATMQAYVEQTWGRWDETEQAERFRQSFLPEHVQIIVVEGREMGLLHVERSPEEIFLVNLQIAPEFQRRGLGTEVMHALMAEARNRGVPLRLQVLKVNPARRLYERLGFTVTGETATHWLMCWAP
jgi:ribosomal protein S18 acetylase RimI-like enzyme